MKKLSRNEMKNVMGGYVPLDGDPNCNEYPGQKTYVCGWTGGAGSTNCTIDICFCDGRPPACNQPRPYDVEP